MQDSNSTRSRPVTTSQVRRGAATAGRQKTSHSYRVQLPHVAPLVIVDCTTAAEAYDRYKQSNGISHSDHEPQIDAVEGE